MSDKTAERPEEPTPGSQVEAQEPPGEEMLPALVDTDLLIEDVSIDGMCGVY